MSDPIDDLEPCHCGADMARVVLPTLAEVRQRHAVMLSDHGRRLDDLERRMAAAESRAMDDLMATSEYVTPTARRFSAAGGFIPGDVTIWEGDPGYLISASDVAKMRRSGHLPGTGRQRDGQDGGSDA